MNTQVKTNEKAEVHKFVGSGQWVGLDKIVRPKDGEIFKVGDLVEWENPEPEEVNDACEEEFIDEFVRGNIDTIYVIDYGYESEKGTYHLEVGLRNEKFTNGETAGLGRLDINDIEKVSE